MGEGLECVVGLCGEFGRRELVAGVRVGLRIRSVSAGRECGAVSDKDHLEKVSSALRGDVSERVDDLCADGELREYDVPAGVEVFAGECEAEVASDLFGRGERPPTAEANP